MKTRGVPTDVPRQYHSVLRERQMGQTREAIFQAATEQLADHGIADFHIPRLAEAAGVSVRTVYRYFPTKEALLEAFAYWLDSQIGAPVPPANLEDLLDGVEATFAAFDENQAVIRSQWATPHGRAVREKGRLRRLKALSTAVRDVTANLPAKEQRQATAILSLLHSARTWQTMRDDFAMDGHESGAVVAWALRTLVADLRRRNKKEANGKTESSPGRMEGDNR